MSEFQFDGVRYILAVKAAGPADNLRVTLNTPAMEKLLAAAKQTAVLEQLLATVLLYADPTYWHLSHLHPMIDPGPCWLGPGEGPSAAVAVLRRLGVEVG